MALKATTGKPETGDPNADQSTEPDHGPATQEPEATSDPATTEPDDGAEAQDTEPQEPATLPAETATEEKTGEDAANEVDKWKALSRKNEDRAATNLKAAQDAQAENVQLKAKIALMEVKQTYPRLTDEMLAACPETDPDKIKEFFDVFGPAVSANPAARIHKPQDDSAVRTAKLASNPQGATHPGRRKGEAYERAMERQRARAPKNRKKE